MGRVAACALCLAIALEGSAAPAATPSPSPPPGPRKRLDLGSFGTPYGTAPRNPTDNLRFESWVEVIGDPKPNLDETMAVWMRHFDLPEPAIYGRGYDVRPDAQPNSVNLLPLFEKIYDKLKKRK